MEGGCLREAVTLGQRAPLLARLGVGGCAHRGALRRLLCQPVPLKGAACSRPLRLDPGLQPPLLQPALSLPGPRLLLCAGDSCWFCKAHLVGFGSLIKTPLSPAEF